MRSNCRHGRAAARTLAKDPPSQDGIVDNLPRYDGARTAVTRR
jgi:hypothetical protein